MLEKTHTKLLGHAKHFEIKDSFSFQKALKIRVSAVRFCPRPPVHTASTQVLAVFYFVGVLKLFGFFSNGVDGH